MKTILILASVLLAATAVAQNGSEEIAVRKIIQDEVTAWNRGDADAYAQHFASDGSFTNMRGGYFTGQEAFRETHEKAFKGPFRGSTKQEDIVSIRFVRPDVAVVETLQSMTGYQELLP